MTERRLCRWLLSAFKRIRPYIWLWSVLEKSNTRHLRMKIPLGRLDCFAFAAIQVNDNIFQTNVVFFCQVLGSLKSLFTTSYAFLSGASLRNCPRMKDAHVSDMQSQALGSNRMGCIFSASALSFTTPPEGLLSISMTMKHGCIAALREG